MKSHKPSKLIALGLALTMGPEHSRGAGSQFSGARLHQGHGGRQGGRCRGIQY